MTRYCYDTSTDLTPERRVYIDRLTSYIDLHTTSFVNDIHSTSYLDGRHVLWQYVVSSYTPLVGPRFQSHVPKLRSKATLPRAGFLPSFHANANPVKSLSNPFEFPSQSLSIHLSFLGQLQGDTLRAIVSLLSLQVSISSHAAASRPEFLSQLQGDPLQAIFLMP